MMRKVRDYDAELKALGDKARALKAKKVQQLGELVTSTGADALDADVLAGALLHIVAEAQVEGNREAWRSDGAAFFQRRGRKAGKGDAGNGQDASDTGAGGSQG
ncbi:conjugal transfer protein TraD [Komagataeibacter europaeus]|uniref:conjugal transfer protein TraD n=1 Tax=Komagataeibacter europaeus TaxID=33995 RepID=UPI001E393EB0